MMDFHQIICPTCGAAIKPGAKFCVKCGQPIAVPEHAPASPDPSGIPAIPPVPVQTPPPLVPPAVPVALPTSLPLPAAIAPAPAMPPPAPVTLTPAPVAQGVEQVLTVVGMVSRKTGLFSADMYHMVVTSNRLLFALQTKQMQAADVNEARERAKAEGKKLFGQIGAQMSTRSGEKYLPWLPDAILAENPQNFMIPLSELQVIETYSGDFEENVPDSMVVKALGDKLQFTISNALGVQRQLKAVLGNRAK